MSKILLTSGSSFSFDFYGLEDSKQVSVGFDKWPTVLANQLEFQLINKSKPGASNLYIFDHLMENIILHEKDIGLVVAAWSYGFKTSIFRNYELNYININDQDFDDKTLINNAEQMQSKILADGLLASSIEQTLRLMVYLQNFCDHKGIKCIHYPLLNIFKTNLPQQSHIKLLEQMINSTFFQKIQNFNNIIGWPCDNYLGGYTYATAHPDQTISNINRHPTEQGQKIIAQEIYDKYLQL
jgi:hypothetical protein